MLKDKDFLKFFIAGITVLALDLAYAGYAIYRTVASETGVILAVKDYMWKISLAAAALNAVFIAAAVIYLVKRNKTKA